MRIEYALPQQIAEAVGSNHHQSEQEKIMSWELDIALLARATERAFISAFQYAKDFPIGAVASRGNSIYGQYAAADVRYDSRMHLHAEIMTLGDAKLHDAPPLDTLAVTVEPCGTCIEELSHAGIERVVFAIPRYRLSELGLVNSREGIFSRDEKANLPFEIVQIGDPELEELNMLLFRNIKRDVTTGQVQFDLPTIRAGLLASEQTTIGRWFLQMPGPASPLTPDSLRSEASVR